MEVHYQLLQCKEENKDQNADEMMCSPTKIYHVLDKPKNGDQS